MFKIIPLLIVISVLFSACATTGASTASSQNNNNAAAREAEEAARAALAAMTGGGGAPPPATGARAPAPTAPSTPSANVPAQISVSGNSPGVRPAWVDNSEAVYNRQRYVSVVGNGNSRTAAERDALGKIIAVFGQTIQADMRLISSYSEAVRGGAIQVTENTEIQDAINTSAQMDTLVGAEIGDNWHDTGANIHYAVAVMERERTSILYADLIRSNERIISDLTTMTPQVRNSFDGYARFRLAATIADANRVYANVLTVVGNTRGINPAEMKRGDDYRIEAVEVAKNIPIGVVVTGDRDNRVRNAFAGVVTRTGFRSGAANSRYVIRVSYNVNRVDLPGQQNQFVRYELIAGLEDTAGGNNTMFAHPSITGREGHLSVSEAEERAFRAVERRVTADFEPAFKNFLDNLISLR